MASTITTSISFDIDMYNEINKIASDLAIPVSRFVQIGVRAQIKLHRKQSVQQYLDSLDEKELKTLKTLLE